MDLPSERGALAFLIVFGIALRVLLIYPFGHLLGEDAYFHRDMVSFLVESGSLAQYNIASWGAAHPYFLALAPKIMAYPFGFHIIVYPVAKLFGDAGLRYFPALVSGLAPLFVYLFMREFSGRGDIALTAAVIYSVPDVVAHSILLLPQGLGILFLPLSLWLYLRTEHGGVVGAMFFFVHPFTGVAIMVAMITLGMWRGDGKKLLKTLALSTPIIVAYSLVTLLNSAPGSTFGFIAPDLVTYGLDRYFSAFSLSLLFPIGLLFLNERKEWYLAICAFMFGIMSFLQVSNLPPERIFAFLALYLSCISAYIIKGLRQRGASAAFAGLLIVLSFYSTSTIFGNIGPSFVEVSSWDYIRENTLGDSVVWGWDRYPQIYTMERSVVFSPDALGVRYICPEAHLLGSGTIRAYRDSDKTNVIYDNYVPIMTLNLFEDG